MHTPRSAVFLGSLFKPPYNSSKVKVAVPFVVPNITVTNIKNINFKLTGFVNGGMHSTYPTRLKWEKSLGGKGGFNKLLDFALR